MEADTGRCARPLLPLVEGKPHRKKRVSCTSRIFTSERFGSKWSLGQLGERKADRTPLSNAIRKKKVPSNAAKFCQKDSLEHSPLDRTTGHRLSGRVYTSWPNVWCLGTGICYQDHGTAEAPTLRSTGEKPGIRKGLLHNRAEFGLSQALATQLGANSANFLMTYFLYKPLISFGLNELGHSFFL